MMDIFKIVQINLHDSWAVSELMCKKLMANNIDVALIQEPWFSGEKSDVLDATMIIQEPVYM